MAMALGAITAVWGVAEAQSVSLEVRSVGPGQMRAAPYLGPTTLASGIVALTQNVLVHLNLLVLPVLLLSWNVRGDDHAG